MKNILRFYNKFEEVFLVVCITAMVILIFVQVCMRYILNSSLVWSEELARILFIWASWIGISLGQKKGEHIKITMVTDRFHGRGKTIVLMIGNICTLVILVILCLSGIAVVDHILTLNSSTPALGIPKFLVYTAVPLSCLLMGLRVIKNMWLLVTGKTKEEVA